MAQAVAATGQVVPEATKNAVLTAFKAQVDTAAPDDSFAAYLGAWNDPSTQAPQFAKNLINTLFNELKAQFVPAVRNKYKRLDREIDQRLQRVDKIEQLPDQSKAGFAAALRGMSGFGAMVRKLKGDNKVDVTPTVGGSKQPEWSGGGSLADMVTEVDGPGALLETDLRDGTFAKKVKEVDAFYKTLLEADVLGEIKKPKLMVHKCMSADKAWAEQAKGNAVPNGFGGYQNGGEVHVGQDVFREILTHEVGHHIENNLPRERWQDIQLFMRARHNAAGGTGKLQAGQSPRLGGTYAATGPYTSTTYNDDVGGTEFTAMTVQYLSDKKDIDTMLDSDPAQVAVSSCADCGRRSTAPTRRCARTTSTFQLHDRPGDGAHQRGRRSRLGGRRRRARSAGVRCPTSRTAGRSATEPRATWSPRSTACGSAPASSCARTGCSGAVTARAACSRSPPASRCRRPPATNRRPRRTRSRTRWTRSTATAPRWRTCRPRSWREISTTSRPSAMASAGRTAR